MIAGFHHIALIVSSEESLNFYQQLGFIETFRKEREYDMVVLMDGYGIQLELFIDPRHEKRTDEPLGLRHFALVVEGRLEDEMKRLGVSGTITTDWNGVRFVFITDPDGTLVELREKSREE